MINRLHEWVRLNQPKNPDKRSYSLDVVYGEREVIHQFVNPNAEIRVQLPEPAIKLPIPKWVYGEEVDSDWIFEADKEAYREDFLRNF